MTLEESKKQFGDTAKISAKLSEIDSIRLYNSRRGLRAGQLIVPAASDIRYFSYELTRNNQPVLDRNNSKVYVTGFFGLQDGEEIPVTFGHFRQRVRQTNSTGEVVHTSSGISYVESSGEVCELFKKCKNISDVESFMKKIAGKTLNVTVETVYTQYGTEPPYAVEVSSVDFA